MKKVEVDDSNYSVTISCSPKSAIFHIKFINLNVTGDSMMNFNVRKIPLINIMIMVFSPK